MSLVGSGSLKLELLMAVSVQSRQFKFVGSIHAFSLRADAFCFLCFTLIQQCWTT